MPVHVNWDDAERTIIRVEYVGSWTWEECFEALSQANGLSASVDHPVARIVDTSEGSMTPPNAMAQIPTLVKLVDPRMDMHVSVGANRLGHMMSDLFFRLGSPTVQRERYHWAESVEQARFLIRLYRERAEDDLFQDGYAAARIHLRRDQRDVPDHHRDEQPPGALTDI